MSRPPELSAYCEQGYWDSRYAKKDEGDGEGLLYDWFSSLDDIAVRLHQIIDRELGQKSETGSLDVSCLNILMNGCGNSRLSEKLVDLGYNCIMNVDFSSVVIDNMARYYGDKKPYDTCLQWKVQDVRSLDLLKSRTFDVVIDKGTLDVFFCEKDCDIWDPSSEIRTNVGRTLEQVERVLKPNGIFVYVTFGQPHFRRPLLERPFWTIVAVTEIGDSFPYYIYVIKKHA